MSFVSEPGVRRGCKYSKVSLQHAQKETKKRLSRLRRLMGIPKASYLASARGGFPGSPMAAVSTRDPWRPSRPLSAGEAHARAGRALNGRKVYRQRLRGCYASSSPCLLFIPPCRPRPSPAGGNDGRKPLPSRPWGQPFAMPQPPCMRQVQVPQGLLSGPR